MKKILIGILALTQIALADHGIHYDEPVSENFVIRWAFQALCDHHFDPRTVWPTADDPVSFNPKDVQAGDMIFVRDFETFFERKHHKIEVPYFVLTHGEFLETFREKYVKYLKDGKILAWFTIHPCAEFIHERVIPIPLGIVQYKELFDKKAKMSKKFERLRNKKKDKLLYMNFTEWCMPERTRIRKLFQHEPYVTYVERCDFKTFVNELSEHKFVLSPPGLGPDCYRVWESVLLGSIPIVQHSHLDFIYEGLPVLFIDRWEEVTEEFLAKKWEEMTARTYSPKGLSMEYWIDRIDQARKKFWPSQAGAFRSITKKRA